MFDSSQIDEGRKIVSQVREDFGIKKKLQHNACRQDEFYLNFISRYVLVDYPGFPGRPVSAKRANSFAANLRVTRTNYLFKRFVDHACSSFTFAIFIVNFLSPQHRSLGAKHVESRVTGKLQTIIFIEIEHDRLY